LVLLPLLRAALADRLLEVEHALVQIDVEPADSAQLAAALASDHGEPDEGAPVGVLECLIDDATGLLRCGRPRIAFGRRRRLGVGDGVGRYPLPSDWAPESALQDEVDLANRRGGQGLGRMWAAAIVALVHPGGSVVDLASEVLAVVSATPELGVQGIHDAIVERGDLQLTEERADVFLGLAAVDVEGLELEVRFGQVPIEQLVDRGLGPWVAPLVDLIEQSDACFLCLFLGLGPAGMVSTRSCRRLETGSMPAYRRTRNAPLFELPIGDGLPPCISRSGLTRRKADNRLRKGRPRLPFGDGASGFSRRQ
jgi:hypothetical protein